MKMGNRKLKALDRLGCRSMSKPPIKDNPTNRQERRAAARYARKSKQK